MYSSILFLLKRFYLNRSSSGLETSAKTTNEIAVQGIGHFGHARFELQHINFPTRGAK
jgi:hypothetical protein